LKINGRVGLNLSLLINNEFEMNPTVQRADTQFELRSVLS